MRCTPVEGKYNVNCQNMTGEVNLNYTETHIYILNLHAAKLFINFAGLSLPHTCKINPTENYEGHKL